MMPPFRKPKGADALPEHHFEVALLPAEREKLLDFLEQDKRPSITARRAIAEKLRDATRRDGAPLPPARINWAQAERQAAERGGSVADLIFDEGRGKEPPAAPAT